LKSALCSKVERKNENELTRILIPKKSDQNKLTEMITRSSTSARFEENGSGIETKSEYEITLVDDSISLNIKSNGDSHPAVKSKWLENVLLPRLNRIHQNLNSNSSSASQGYPSTLSLVDKQVYQSKYNALKEEYGKKLAADWPEVTDPQKFVFEDIAIAAYLLTLFEQIHGNKSITFLDIGCGNGLLVYLLNQSGKK